MPSFLSSAALVAYATLSLAAPANIYQRSMFQIDQVAAGKQFKSGPIQLLKVYRKFNKEPPTAVVEAAAAAASQTGSVSANPEQYDESYLCPVTIGNSKLNLDFDTGSADLWVFSDLTPKAEASGHSVYSTSSGTLKQDYTWSIKYGDSSSAGGKVYADKVQVGPVTATSQAVEAATSVSSEFTSDTNNDGLLGLAFSSINTVQPQSQTTFFDTVKSTLAKQLFTADLKKGTAGSYTFGYIDSSKYTGSITYTPVNNAQGFWQFTAGGYSVGSQNATTGSIGTAIADTGTSLLYVPTAVAQAYYKQVSGASFNQQQQGYIYPCQSNLPAFNVAIGGRTFTVPGSDISYAPISDGSSTCFGGIQENTGIGFSIFGDIFLKSVYAIFDQTQSTPRLGFAEQ